VTKLPYRCYLLAIVFASSLSLVVPAQAQNRVDDEAVIGEFLLLLLGSEEGKRQALTFVDDNWQPGFIPMLLEVLTFNHDTAFSGALVALLEQKSGRTFGFNLEQWQQWLWQRPAEMHPAYPEFKSALYGLIDQRFETYFGRDRPLSIRLDEVIWGGVEQDGIPPLRNPLMVAAAEAEYLEDGNIVFGLEVNGDSRAYPKRILAWHEMFVDEVGGVPVAGVYCTLCGSMILYRTELDGVNYELGTSGFLYRSNKLMYDRGTQSLWNTLWGKPVIGPLVEKQINLRRMSVVTTTWGEWRRRHPRTRVLSLATGHERDYGEGAAYRDYFATDQLMFPVPELDGRLNNKDEVLGLVLARYPGKPMAIAVGFLADHPLYQDQIGELEFVVLTDPSGASRVYESGGLKFTAWDGDSEVTDEQGITWRLAEANLEAGDGRLLYRLPAHRAFWFGWYSAYSHTRLVN
jgi:hypothetical protein